MSRHMVRGRQLSRDTEHRKAMRRNLVQSLFEHGKVRTTLPKAKEVRAMAERLITLARIGSLTARRRVISTLCDRRLTDEAQEFTGRTVVQKLFDEIAPKFVDRPGGYLQIIKLAKFRIGDAGSLVQLQLISDQKPRGTVRRSAGLRRKHSERRHQFAASISRKNKSEKSEESASSSAPAAAAIEPA